MNQQDSKDTTVPQPTKEEPAASKATCTERELTDKDLIVTLLAFGIPYTRRLKKHGFKTLFWFDTGEDKTQQVLQAWQQAAPPPKFTIEEFIAVARVIYSAERVFNSAVHDDF